MFHRFSDQWNDYGISVLITHHRPVHDIRTSLAHVSFIISDVHIGTKAETFGILEAIVIPKVPMGLQLSKVAGDLFRN